MNDDSFSLHADIVTLVKGVANSYKPMPIFEPSTFVDRITIYCATNELSNFYCTGCLSRYMLCPVFVCVSVTSRCSAKKQLNIGIRK